MGNADLKVQLAQHEKEFKEGLSARLQEFLQYLNSKGVSEEAFLRYAGIQGKDAIGAYTRIKSALTVVEKEQTVYAALFYHANIEIADPRNLPHRYFVHPSTGPKEKSRSWDSHKLDVWIKMQPARFIDLVEHGFSYQGIVEGSAEVGHHTDQLIQVLTWIITQGTSPNRTQLVAEHGQAMGKLHYLLEILLSGDISKRELSIKAWLELGEMFNNVAQ